MRSGTGQSETCDSEIPEISRLALSLGTQRGRLAHTEQAAQSHALKICGRAAASLYIQLRGKTQGYVALPHEVTAHFGDGGM